MDRICQIVDKNGFVLIEDAAQASDSRYKINMQVHFVMRQLSAFTQLRC